MPRPKRFKPTVQPGLFGNSGKSYFGRGIAEKLAKRGVIAGSRIGRRGLRGKLSKTVDPIIEVGELFEKLSRKGFLSRKFADFLSLKGIIERFSEFGFFNSENLQILL